MTFVSSTHKKYGFFIFLWTKKSNSTQHSLRCLVLMSTEWNPCSACCFSWFVSVYGWVHYSNCSCIATISNLVDNLVDNSNITEEADSRIISPRSKCRQIQTLFHLKQSTKECAFILHLSWRQLFLKNLALRSFSLDNIQ